MADNTIDTQALEIVKKAFQQAVMDASLEHPALAQAAAQVDVEQTVVPKLREMPEYQVAEEAYIQGRIEIDFFNNVIKLIGQVLPMVLPLIGG